MQHRSKSHRVGALLSGVVADILRLRAALEVLAVLTFLSGVQVALRMRETLKRNHGTDEGGNLRIMSGEQTRNE